MISQKTNYFLIVVLLVSGLFVTYFGTRKDHEVSSYEIDGASVTVIDLATKNNNFNFPIVVGCVLLGLAFLIALRTFIKNSTVKDSKDYKLTYQEQKVVSLIKDGKTNKEIAQELSISLSTVKTHINNIYKGLGISSRSELLK